MNTNRFHLFQNEFLEDSSDTSWTTYCSCEERQISNKMNSSKLEIVSNNPGDNLSVSTEIIDDGEDDEDDLELDYSFSDNLDDSESEYEYEYEYESDNSENIIVNNGDSFVHEYLAFGLGSLNRYNIYNKFIRAINTSDLNEIIRLTRLGIPLISEFVVEAAENHEIEILVYLLEMGCPLTSLCMEAGAHCIHILRILSDYGCPWNIEVLLFAIDNEFYDIVEYALQNDCPKDITCTALAARRSITILRILYEYDCPWNHSTILSAFRSGSLKNLEFALQHGCPLNLEMYLEIVKMNDIQALKIIEEAGYILEMKRIYH